MKSTKEGEDVNDRKMEQEMELAELRAEWMLWKAEQVVNELIRDKGTFVEAMANFNTIENGRDYETELWEAAQRTGDDARILLWEIHSEYCKWVGKTVAIKEVDDMTRVEMELDLGRRPSRRAPDEMLFDALRGIALVREV